MDIEFQKKWDELSRKLERRFGEMLDVQAILFIIGLQELGLNFDRLSKDKKLEVMHVAVCTLLEPYGYYSFEGRDKDDWPHWAINKKLPALNAGEQERLMKESIIDYFNL